MSAGLQRIARSVPRYWPYLLTASSFLVSRLVYRSVFRVRLDTAPLDFFIQYIDPWFFKHDFARSIFYLHHQAPLQNLLVGVPLRLFDPALAFVVLDAVYIALGLALVLGMLHAMLRLGAHSGIAAISSAVYAISPTTVLYENWLFYHLPTASCLMLSLLALLRYWRSGSQRAALAFFTLLATVALLRSTFGPFFVAAVAALLCVCPPPFGRSVRSARATLIRAAALPLLLLALVSSKPTLLIGYGYGEGLLWGNLTWKMMAALPEPEREHLLRTKAISPAAPLFSLGDLATFAELRVPYAATGVPLLDMERRPNGGSNTHALQYLLLARRYYKPDALFLLSHYPLEYAKSVAHAFSLYAAAATTDPSLSFSANYRPLRELIRRIDSYCGVREEGRLLLLTIMLPLILVCGVSLFLRANAHVHHGRCARAALGFMLLTIGYVTAVTTLISFGDFSRYRYDIDPFYLVIFGVSLSTATRATVAIVRERLRLFRRRRLVRRLVA